MTVTNAYASSPCAQVGNFRDFNSTTSSTAARISATTTATGNGTNIQNYTTLHNGTFMGSPVPFTGGSGISKRCGAVVLIGQFLVGMVVAG